MIACLYPKYAVLIYTIYGNKSKILIFIITLLIKKLNNTFINFSRMILSY
ncbi:hypothetical protein ANASTE_00753 [Anaerofustis stercorihominis DSM 17244]|uniref:Uncharacterized protein n=1 Tax=Anaerofustis stercorihominis DSM 17244 TaxID=445971 RepID=B1C7Q1_9FIRM|nr:hypothetical protein ANASTE_00753 [Anaerofustis stercorihominis DSM 17244]